LPASASGLLAEEKGFEAEVRRETLPVASEAAASIEA
jgi:hypothetical protein